MKGTSVRTIPILILAAGVAFGGPSQMLKFKKTEEPSPLDKLILQDGTSSTLGGPEAAPGSTFRQGSRLADMIRDARA